MAEFESLAAPARAWCVDIWCAKTAGGRAGVREEPIADCSGLGDHPAFDEKINDGVDAMFFCESRPLFGAIEDQALVEPNQGGTEHFLGETVRTGCEFAALVQR